MKLIHMSQICSDMQIRVSRHSMIRVCHLWREGPNHSCDKEKKKEREHVVRLFTLHPYNETIDFSRAMSYPNKRAMTTPEGKDVVATR